MKVLLVLFIVFIAISPLLSMAPGRQQRKIARLRQRAQQTGMQVTLAELPRTVADPLNPSQKVPCYRLLRSPDSPAPPLAGRSFFPEAEGHWRVDVGGESQQDVLTFLPPGVKAIVVDKSGSSAYWDESGGEPEVDKLGDCLSVLNVTEDN